MSNVSTVICVLSLSQGGNTEVRWEVDEVERSRQSLKKVPSHIDVSRPYYLPIFIDLALKYSNLFLY